MSSIPWVLTATVLFWPPHVKTSSWGSLSQERVVSFKRAFVTLAAKRVKSCTWERQADYLQQVSLVNRTELLPSGRKTICRSPSEAKWSIHPQAFSFHTTIPIRGWFTWLEKVTATSVTTKSWRRSRSFTTWRSTCPARRSAALALCPNAACRLNYARSFAFTSCTPHAAFVSPFLWLCPEKARPTKMTYTPTLQHLPRLSRLKNGSKESTTSQSSCLWKLGLSFVSQLTCLFPILCVTFWLIDRSSNNLICFHHFQPKRCERTSPCVMIQLNESFKHRTRTTTKSLPSSRKRRSSTIDRLRWVSFFLPVHPLLHLFTLLQVFSIY